MFKVGEFVQYGNNGVCTIQEIIRDGIGLEEGKSYYLLVPLGNRGSKIYTPVDNEKVVMRRIMTPEEVDQLVKQIPEIPELWIPDERSREQEYKKALHSGNCEEWVQIIKTLYLRKQKRALQGKRVTSTDERYMKNAEDRLYSEIAIALGKEKEDVKNYIVDHIEKDLK